jgi:FdhD protein
MSDVLGASYCGEESGNRIDITLDAKRKAEKNVVVRRKELFTYSSCGLCGKEMVGDICTRGEARAHTFTMPLSRIDDLLATVERHQGIYPGTGGAHGAAIFDASLELLAFSEDVGRHNALDKAVGRLLFQGKLDRAMVVVLTSRLSYEMVLKTGRLRAEVVIGFSSPTSLAVDLAERIGLTVVGGAKTGSGRIYAGGERIV